MADYVRPPNHVLGFKRLFSPLMVLFKRWTNNCYTEVRIHTFSLQFLKQCSHRYTQLTHIARLNTHTSNHASSCTNSYKNTHYTHHSNTPSYSLAWDAWGTCMHPCVVVFGIHADREEMLAAIDVLHLSPPPQSHSSTPRNLSFSHFLCVVQPRQLPSPKKSPHPAYWVKRPPMLHPAASQISHHRRTR